SQMHKLLDDVEARLHESIRNLGLGDVAQKLRAAARPALGVHLEARPCSLGSSRVGGVPDLPQGSAWPCAGDLKMTFVAQIRCEDLAGALDSVLPKTGLLSFFLSADERATDIDHRVLWHEARSLVRSASPSKEDVVNKHYHPAFPELAMSFFS